MIDEPMNRLQAVLFDLDDTLHDDTLTFTRAARDVASAIADVVNIEPGRLAHAFITELESFWQRFKVTDLRPGENVRARMWAQTFARFYIFDDLLAERCAREFEAARKQYYELFPVVEGLLAELRSRRLKLGLLTNGLITTHREKIALLELEALVDAVFLSDEIGISKPDARAFGHACDQLGVSAHATIMVGDRFDKDIAGALDAGLHALWINVRNEPAPELSTRFITVATMDDAAALLLKMTS